LPHFTQASRYYFIEWNEQFDVYYDEPDFFPDGAPWYRSRRDVTSTATAWSTSDDYSLIDLAFNTQNGALRPVSSKLNMTPGRNSR
jgi:hypothetical protein